MMGYVYLRLPGGSTVKFRYYLLGGDTAAPSGLYARLCHAFLVLPDLLFHAPSFTALYMCFIYCYCDNM